MFLILTNPQIQGVRCSVVRGTVSKITLSCIIPFFKPSIVIFGDPDTVICSVASTSSSSKHHHRTITSTPLAPETNAAAALNIAATVCFFEARCRAIRASIIHRAASKAFIVRPNVTITEFAITGQKSSESVSSETVSIRTKESSMRAIVAAGDFNLTSSNSPKRF